MATNEPSKSGQDGDFDRKPTTVLSSQQQQPENVIVPDLSNDITSAPISSQKRIRSTNAEKSSQAKVHKPSNYPEPPKKPELDDNLSQNDLEKLEMMFYHNQYPDMRLMRELSIELNVCKKTIVDWFENKRSEVEEKEKHWVIMCRLQAMQQEQQYNKQLIGMQQQQLWDYRHQVISQSAFMTQASSSMSYTGQPPVHVQYFTSQQLPVGQYFTPQQQPAGQYSSPQQQPVGQYFTSQQQPVGQYFTSQQQPVGQYFTSQQQPVGHYFTSQQQPVGHYFTSQQQPPGQYLSLQHLIYLETLFISGERYSDTSELAMKLNISKQHLDIWFEQRRDIWKKELAEQAYNRMRAAQQHS